MRPWLSLALGTLIGQWLAFSGAPSPADVHALGTRAFERQDYAEAARQWSRAVSLQPDNATFHYFRGMALAHLGHTVSAVDAYQLAVLLEPSGTIARLAHEGLTELGMQTAERGGETIVPIEPSRGVWVAQVVLNDARTGRFLVDTGASVMLVSPMLAVSLGLPLTGSSGSTELHTVAGPTAGPSATLASVRLGAAEARNVPVVVHEPGLGLDGILGNTFLGRFTVTLDAGRRLLRLRPLKD
jgi:clan AA aspartic protease (TIGR02281 family)